MEHKYILHRVSFRCRFTTIEGMLYPIELTTARRIHTDVQHMTPKVKLYWLCKNPADNHYCIMDTVVPDTILINLEFVGLLALPEETSNVLLRYVQTKGARHYYRFSRWNHFVIHEEYDPGIKLYDEHDIWYEYSQILKHIVFNHMTYINTPG